MLQLFTDVSIIQFSCWFCLDFVEVSLLSVLCQLSPLHVCGVLLVTWLVGQKLKFVVVVVLVK